MRGIVVNFDASESCFPVVATVLWAPEVLLNIGHACQG